MDGLVVFEASLHFAHVKRFWEKMDIFYSRSSTPCKPVGMNGYLSVLLLLGCQGKEGVVVCILQSTHHESWGINVSLLTNLLSIESKLAWPTL